LFHFREEPSSLDVESHKKRLLARVFFWVATFRQLAKFFLKLAKNCFLFWFSSHQISNFEKKKFLTKLLDFSVGF
jgi:hypothetical protein